MTSAHECTCTRGTCRRVAPTNTGPTQTPNLKLDMCPRKLEICPRIHLPRLSSSAARVSVDTMPVKKKGTRPQPVLGTRVASAPAQQLPPALPVAAAGVKAEDPQRDSVQTVSDPSVPSASAKPVNVAVPEINQELIALVVKARTTIVDHAYFAGATTSAPLGMSSSANLMNGGHHRTAHDKVLCFKNLQEIFIFKFHRLSPTSIFFSGWKSKTLLF